MQLGRAAARIIAASTLVAVGGGACVDRSQPGAEALVAAGLVGDPTFAGYDITADEADCIAAAVVTRLGDGRVAELLPADDTDDEVVDLNGAGAGTLDETDTTTPALDYGSLDESELDVVAGAVGDCLDAGDGPKATAVVTAAVADGILVSATDEFPVTEDEAECVGDSVVASLGTSTMIAVGIRSVAGVASELDGEESAAFVDAFLACTDVRARVLAGIGADPDNPISDEVVACLDANITDEQVDELFALGFADAGGSSDNQARADEVLAGAIASCT